MLTARAFCNTRRSVGFAEGSGPPACTAIAISLATRVNCFAIRFQRANIACFLTSNMRPMPPMVAIRGQTARLAATSLQAIPMSAVPADESPSAAFRDLALSEPVLRALTDVGYESPSPIQAATIPVLLSGADMLGQAQTGTGKTAAFALPALSRIDLSGHEPQVLVLVPTRELALQVAEAFQRYAAHIKGFHVLPIYGGQSYQPQLNALRRGVHVVVGTPGRVIDHMNRGTLKLGGLSLLVLDEADEMLAMGFVDAVESILEQTPPQRQVALFSATIPSPIRRIASKHLRSPVEVTIKSKTSTATNIRQRYWMVSGMHKLDALTRS